MPRYAARVDANQREIVKGLLTVGCSVFDLSTVGRGCPDLLIAYRGLNVLVEIKDGNKSAGRRKLTPAQEKIKLTWKGPIIVVTSLDNALMQLGIICK